MRPSWQEYFISILDATALRASCDRGKSAAIIVRDNRVLSCGYVGAPSGLPSCDEVGHELYKRYEISYDDFENLMLKDYVPIEKFSTHCLRTIHGEQNAIINCARNGVSTLGATMYCTMQPCKVCMMMIIQSGIVKVIAKNAYHKSKESLIMAEKAGVEVITLNDTLLY